LQGIINSLLLASKLEILELTPKLEEEDLSFLIKYCLEEIHPLIAQREHSINYEIHDSIMIRFEKEEIHDVIINLLTNAINYTPPKGWIDIKTETKDDFVIFSIKDNGIGFTEEEKSRIFKQFGKVERFGQGFDLITEGSGLGLFISKKIIEAHGGKLWMESEGRNKGSTFYFSLPLKRD
jgi:signal transduction histidine kinase